MGCDIHCYVEVRDREGAWHVDNLRLKNPYYDPEDPSEGAEIIIPPMHVSRDYELFAALADVRGHHPSGPIAAGRGIPADCSEEIKAEYAAWDSDAHSASFVLLSELREKEKLYAFTKRSGFVTNDAYEGLQKDTPVYPSIWWQGGGDPTKQKFAEWIEETSYIADLIQRIEFRLYEARHYFHKDECVRIVFWFDN